MNENSATADPRSSDENGGKGPDPFRNLFYFSLLALGCKREAKRNVTGPPRLQQLGLDRNGRQFPRPPPSSRVSGQAPGLAALGFVSLSFESLKRSLDLASGSEQEASCQASAGLALLPPGTRFSPFSEVTLPPVLLLAFPVAIFRLGLLV